MISLITDQTGQILLWIGGQLLDRHTYILGSLDSPWWADTADILCEVQNLSWLYRQNLKQTQNTQLHISSHNLDASF